MELKTGLQINDRVRLVKPLEQGGQGTVWVGFHETLETQVAVKFMLGGEAERKRFRREARTIAKIGNPHIVQVLDFGVLGDDQPYIVMELLKGTDLGKRLSKLKWMDIKSVETMVKQLAHALSAAHAKGVIHRDIKPENIILVDAPDNNEVFVKLIDFGVATGATASKETKLTRIGAMIGSPKYMSPEQFGGADRVDQRADIWGLGAITYRALAGKEPFAGDTLHQLIRSVYCGTLIPASELRSELPAALDSWFARTLALEPRDRFRTMRKAADAFSAALAGETTQLRAPPIPRPGASVRSETLAKKERHKPVRRPPRRNWATVKMTPDPEENDAKLAELKVEELLAETPSSSVVDVTINMDSEDWHDLAQGMVGRPAAEAPASPTKPAASASRSAAVTNGGWRRTAPPVAQSQPPAVTRGTSSSTPDSGSGDGEGEATLVFRSPDETGQNHAAVLAHLHQAMVPSPAAPPAPPAAPKRPEAWRTKLHSAPPSSQRADGRARGDTFKLPVGALESAMDAQATTHRLADGAHLPVAALLQDTSDRPIQDTTTTSATSVANDGGRRNDGLVMLASFGVTAAIIAIPLFLLFGRTTPKKLGSGVAIACSSLQKRVEQSSPVPPEDDFEAMPEEPAEPEPTPEPSASASAAPAVKGRLPSAPGTPMKQSPWPHPKSEDPPGTEGFMPDGP